MAFLRRISGKVDPAQVRCAAWVSRIRHLARSDSGGSEIEFMLSLTALLTFVFVVMEIGIVFYTYGMISESAREATRYAIVRGSTCLTSSSTSCTATASSISSYATGLGYPNIGGGTMIAATSFPDGNQAPGSRVKVDIKYSVSIKVPFVPKNALALESSSEMYILQ